MLGFWTHHSYLIAASMIQVRRNNLFQPIIALMSYSWLVLSEVFEFFNLLLKWCLLFIHLLQCFLPLIAILEHLEPKVITSTLDRVNWLSDIAVAFNPLDD